MTGDEFVEPASTKYQDWTGTFAADNADFEMVVERLGLPPDRYMVVGFRVRHEEGVHAVDVFVVEQDPDDRHHIRDLVRLGVLPVIEYTNTGLRADAFLQMFKRMEVVSSVSLVANEGIRMRVAEQRPLYFEDPWDDERNDPLELPPGLDDE